MRPLTETDLLDRIVDLAYRTQWLIHHDRPARTERGWRTAVQGHAGFPDLVLVREGVVLIRELKGPKTRLEPDQRTWAFAIDTDWQGPQGGWPDLVRQNLLYDVWRPADWDLIVATLTTRTKATT